MQGENVGVGEGGDGFRLVLEAGEGVGVLRDLVGQHLDRHVTLEPRVPRPINLAHSARAERNNDLVWPEARARGEAHAVCLPGSEEGAGRAPRRGDARSGGPSGSYFCGDSSPSRTGGSAPTGLVQEVVGGHRYVESPYSLRLAPAAPGLNGIPSNAARRSATSLMEISGSVGPRTTRSLTEVCQSF